MKDTEEIILNLLVDGRELIAAGCDILKRVRAGDLPPREARAVYTHLGVEIPWMWTFASAPIYACSRKSLRNMALEFEILRAEAGKLM